MSVIQQHLLIRGRVQGVYFRDSTLKLARALGLVGWVRNRRDGAVEVVVQGPPGEVRRFSQWCRRGPPAARVESFDLQDEPSDPLLLSFRVRSTVDPASEPAD